MSGKKEKKTASRKHYQSIDQTRKFEDWVNKLELRQSYIFRFLIFIDYKFSLKNMGLWALFSLSFSFLLFARFDYQGVIFEGDIATMDIKSPFNFTIVDELATEAKKEATQKEVLSIFKYTPLETNKQLDQIFEAFSSFRRRVQLNQLSKGDLEILKEEFEKSLGQKISDRTFDWLLDMKFSSKIYGALRDTIENWSSYFLVENPEKHTLVDQESISLISIYKKKTDETIMPVSHLKDIYRRSALKKDLPWSVNRLSKVDQKRTLNLAFDLLQPNVVYDEETTLKRRKSIVGEIIPATISVNKNQLIVGMSSIISRADVKIVDHIRKLQFENKKGLVPLGMAFLFFIFIIISSNLITAFKTIERNLNYRVHILLLISLISMALWKVFLYIFETSLVQRFGEVYPQGIFTMASPFVAPIIMAGLISRSPYLLFMFTFFSSMSFAILSEQSFSTFVMVSMASFAALRVIYDCEKRSDVYKASLISAAIVFIGGVIFAFVNNPFLLKSPETWLWFLGASLIGAILSALLTFVMIPILEAMFEITTDLKLLDLSSMNHSLLRDLIVKAPGTYHHSMVVGGMCEAAAGKIGANSLLNKVMGYFHDIGKMEHPSYFIENQGRGDNPHDLISPYLSKTIIMAHVKDGVEMAVKAKLGREIIDGIKQHHGTTTISYFLDRARKQLDKPEDIKEEEFRYAGPKPQFKESAILMLADSIEAAARSMEDPSPTKLDHLVENMIERKFVDGQLDECDLNFEELTLIKKTFYRTILGVYHQRVEYPSNEDQDKKVVDKPANA